MAGTALNVVNILYDITPPKRTILFNARTTFVSRDCVVAMISPLNVSTDNREVVSRTFYSKSAGHSRSAALRLSEYFEIPRRYTFVVY